MSTSSYVGLAVLLAVLVLPVLLRVLRSKGESPDLEGGFSKDAPTTPPKSALPPVRVSSKPPTRREPLPSSRPVSDYSTSDVAGLADPSNPTGLLNILNPASPLHQALHSASEPARHDPSVASHHDSAPSHSPDPAPVHHDTSHSSSHSVPDTASHSSFDHGSGGGGGYDGGSFGGGHHH